jgi:hypothetical protein
MSYNIVCAQCGSFSKLCICSQKSYFHTPVAVAPTNYYTPKEKDPVGYKTRNRFAILEPSLGNIYHQKTLLDKIIFLKDILRSPDPYKKELASTEIKSLLPNLGFYELCEFFMGNGKYHTFLTEAPEFKEIILQQLAHKIIKMKLKDFLKAVVTVIQFPYNLFSQTNIENERIIAELLHMRFSSWVRAEFTIDKNISIEFTEALSSMERRRANSPISKIDLTTKVKAILNEECNNNLETYVVQYVKWQEEFATPTAVTTSSSTLPTLKQDISTVNVKKAYERMADLSWKAWIGEGMYDYLASPLVTLYSYTFGPILNPLFYRFMQVIDLFRRGTYGFMQYIFNPVKGANRKERSSMLGIPFSFLGAGTSFVGTLNIVSETLKRYTKHSFAWEGMGFGTASVVVQGIVNNINSMATQNKETASHLFTDSAGNPAWVKKSLSPFQLNALWLAVSFASIASGILASSAGHTFFYWLGVQRTDNENYKLSENEESYAFWIGLVMGIFNAMSSFTGGMGANIRFFEEVLPKMKLLWNDRHYYIISACAVMMFITTSVLIVYTPPVTEAFVGEKNKAGLKAYLLMSIGAALSNLTVIPMFFNYSFDLICSIAEQMYNRTITLTEFLKKLVAFIIFAPFYVMSTFGNGRTGALSLWKSDLWGYIVGAAAATCFVPSAILSISKLVDTVWPSLDKKAAEDKTPLLPTNVPQSPPTAPSFVNPDETENSYA